MLVRPSCQSVSAMQEDICPLFDPQVCVAQIIPYVKDKRHRNGCTVQKVQENIRMDVGGVKVKYYYLIIKLIIKNLYMS